MLLPALQKFYNALKHLNQFSLQSGFFDNIASLDVFLSEFRSVTLVLQKSLGGNNNPIYQKNLNEFLLKDKRVAEWLNDNRNIVIHEHPFKLKKTLRVVIYDSGKSIEFKKFEQTIEDEKPIGDYEKMIKNTLLSVLAPEVSFSAQYVFVDEDDKTEINIFDFIESGVVAMWQFLHAMKKDLAEVDKTTDNMMTAIDEFVMKMPNRWMIDSIDYCYYRSSDCFERGELLLVALPDVKYTKPVFMNMARKINPSLKDLYDAFIWVHSWLYIQQNQHLMNTFFIEYKDNTYRTITFSATLRTTLYRYINRVAKIVEENDVVNVYFVTEMVMYNRVEQKDLSKFLQLNYREREKFQSKTLLAFYKITAQGEVIPVLIEADGLMKSHSVGVSLEKHRFEIEKIGPIFMLSPVVDSFKKKLN